VASLDALAVHCVINLVYVMLGVGFDAATRVGAAGDDEGPKAQEDQEEQMANG
jgi:hypothetical protein